PQGIRLFADALHQIAWVADERGSPEYFNASWTSYTGLTNAQSSGSGWVLALHPDDVVPAFARWDECSPQYFPFSIDYRFRSATGEYRAFRGAMFPLRDAEGSVRKWIGTCDEVDLIARSGEKLRLLADALPVLVWATDRNDRLMFVNTAWYEYTRLPPGTTIEERNAIVHPDDVRRLMGALRGGEPEVEFRLRRASDGEYRWHLVRWHRTGFREDMPFHRIGTAVDVHEERLTRNRREDHLRAIAEAVPEIVWSIRADGIQDYANNALAEYTGVPVETFYREGWSRVIHPDDLATMHAAWTHARGTHEDYQTEYRLRRADGVYRWFIDRARAIRDERGAVVRWFGTCSDIEDQKRAIGEQAYLAEMTRVVNSSLDFDDTLRNIARLTVSALCDWCQIDLEVEGEMRIAELAHRDPERHREMQSLRGRRHPAHAAKATIVHDPTPEKIAAAIPGEGQHGIYMRAGMRAVMTTPLEVRGKIIGAITYARAAAGVPYSDADVAFAQSIADRAGFALDNARLYQREHRVANAMQAASLPKSLPAFPGVTMHAVYVPRGSEAKIGGDWYDAFRLSDGRLVISIGDVAGSGVDAAVTMSNMRQIIRGTAQVHPDPVLMLDAADRALSLEDPHRFVTAFVSVLDSVSGEMTYACAGHVPPVIRHRDGSLEELICQGLPFGLRDRGTRRSGHIALSDDDLVVFYTDGLVESMHDLGQGLMDLEVALTDPLVNEIANPAQYLQDVMLANGATDDVAILTLRIGPEFARTKDVVRWHYDSVHAQMLSGLRKEVRDTLARLGMTAHNLE
ncbi:MAG: PAS domain-containing protein, partial [Candidatus Eremiobacteraeota bacterium]|nr:PAS domain-containing protein [Candidatus Eremiobacteraeota bacterium]